MPRIGLPPRMRMHSGEFLDLGRQFSVSIAGVDDRARLEEQRRGFGIGLRSVLDAVGTTKSFRGASATLRSFI